MLKSKSLFLLLIAISAVMIIGCSDTQDTTNQNFEDPTVSTFQSASLTIKAVGIDSNSLPDVCFNIKKSGEIIDTITTDETGIAVCSFLEVGEYAFVMDSAPDGLIIDKTEYFFRINNKDLEIVVEIESNSD